MLSSAHCTSPPLPPLPLQHTLKASPALQRTPLAIALSPQSGSDPGHWTEPGPLSPLRSVRGARAPPAGPAAQGGAPGSESGPGLAPGMRGVAVAGARRPALAHLPHEPGCNPVLSSSEIGEHAIAGSPRPIPACRNGSLWWRLIFPDKQGRDPPPYCLTTSFFNLLTGEGRGLLPEGRTPCFDWFHRPFSQCSKRRRSHFSRWVIFRIP